MYTYLSSIDDVVSESTDSSFCSSDLHKCNTSAASFSIQWSPFLVAPPQPIQLSSIPYSVRKRGCYAGFACACHAQVTIFMTKKFTSVAGFCINLCQTLYFPPTQKNTRLAKIFLETIIIRNNKNYCLYSFLQKYFSLTSLQTEQNIMP